MLVSVVERSGDRKLTHAKNVSSTWVPQQSCHSDCPFKANGCYAEFNKSGLHTHRLNRVARQAKQALAKLRVRLAREEASLIRTKLTGTRQLRVHVVGDCATPQAASIVGAAMVDHEKKHGQPAWTYTHSWRRILPKHWKGARVMASCEKAEDVPKAMARGYAAVLVVPPHPTNKVYQFKGLNIVPCPAQFKDKTGKYPVTCEYCTLCKNPDRLRERNLVVGFQPDGYTTGKVLKVINA
jgi:hypothetical protein